MKNKGAIPIAWIGASIVLHGVWPCLASAQTIERSSVEMYGLVGTYAGHLKRSGVPGSSVSVGSGGLTTSYWGLRGREDIGSGMAVIFSLESFFQSTDGKLGRKPNDPFFSRNAYVGLTGPGGTLKLGRQTNPTYLTMQKLNPFGASVVFSPIVVQSFVPAYQGVLIGDTVWNNAVQYSLPQMGGWDASVMYGFDNDDPGKSGTANIGVHSSYSSGRFYAGVSMQRVRTPTIGPVSEQKAWLGGMRYKTDFATLYGAVGGSSTYGARSNSHTYELGVSVPVGANNAILAEWSRTSLHAQTASNWFRNTAALAYDYNLSKRTDIYVVALYDKLNGQSSALSEVVGLRHKF